MTKPRQKTGRITVTENEDGATQSLLVHLEHLGAPILIRCLSHERHDIRERALSELRRRADIYDRTDAMVHELMDQVAGTKAYGRM
jgi:hypothetical protein